jgi:hypothetical protein
MGKTRKKNRKHHAKKIYTKKHYQSGDGMVTTVWGPPLWHFIHTMSFNYPIHPTSADKKYYRAFIFNLRYILPCRYCRENLSKNLKAMPLTEEAMKNRNSFSRWVFKLHELINAMLGKKSGLRYCEVRERYEHFRSRCVEDKKFSTRKIKETINKSEEKKEKGCTEPLYGSKSKCIVKIVPKESRGESFQMDKKCLIKR